MKIYLAGSYSSKEKITGYAQELRAIGIECTSTWLEETYAPNTQIHQVLEQELVKYSIQDLKDIDRADGLVLIAEEVNPRGGAHVEFGYALATGKAVMVVGPNHNIFHYLPQVGKFKTWELAKKFLILASLEEDQLHQDNGPNEPPPLS